MASSDTLRSSDASVVVDVAEATNFLKQFFQGTAKQRARRVVKAPLGAVQTAALHHPDPWVRRDCLFFLDHYANDQSMALFARALGDPVEFVRNMALHGLSCQACKSEVLCTADVAAGLVEVLEHDPSHELRTKAIQLLFQLSGREARARAALEEASVHDSDPIVRQAARSALAGRFVAPRKRYERRQRRHGRGPASLPAGRS
jgi:HEAT repeats